MKKTKCQICEKDKEEKNKYVGKHIGQHLIKHKGEIFKGKKINNNNDYYDLVYKNDEVVRAIYIKKLKTEFFYKYYFNSLHWTKFLIKELSGRIATFEDTTKGSKHKYIGMLASGASYGFRFNKNVSIVCLDIDIDDKAAIMGLIQLLRGYGIKDNNIIFYSSGNKGYHIDIATRGHISSHTMQKFFERLKSDLKRLNLNELVENIELYGNNDKGYFIPFNTNYKSSGNGYCGLVDEDFNIIYDEVKEVEALKNIINNNEKLDNNIIYKVISDGNNKDIIDNENINKIEKHKSIIEQEHKALGIYLKYNLNGFNKIKQIEEMKTIEKGERNDLIFIYCLALRSTGLEDSKAIYNKAIKVQENLTGYASSWQEVKSETKATVKSILKKDDDGNYVYNYFIQYKPFITKENIKTIMTIKSSALRRIYTSMVIHANIFKDESNTFYMTYKQMNESLNHKMNRGEMLEYIKELETLKYLKVKSRNVKKWGNLKCEPNEYIIDTDGQDAPTEERFYLDYSFICSEEMNDANRELLTVREIRKYGGYKKINKIAKDYKSA